MLSKQTKNLRERERELKTLFFPIGEGLKTIQALRTTHVDGL